LVEAIKIHLKAAREAACGKKPDGPRSLLAELLL
jgi:hypothetical protein